MIDQYSFYSTWLSRFYLLFGCLLILISCQETQIEQSEWQWQRAEAGLTHQVIVTSVAIDPRNSDRMWAGYYGSGGLVMSEDGGRSWDESLTRWDDNPVFDILPHEAAGETRIYAATRDGLYVSPDGQSGWAKVSGIPETSAFALAKNEAGDLFVGGDWGEIYVQRNETTEAWEALAFDQTSDVPTATLSLAVSPDGQCIYAGTSKKGIFASQDGGETWQQSYAGEYAPNMVINPATPKMAVASLRERLVRTTDGGQSWHTLSATEEWGWQQLVSLLWLADGTLVSGTGQSQLYVSQDQGDTWVEQGRGLDVWGLIDLAVIEDEGRDPNSGPPRLVAGTWAGVYDSVDGGRSLQDLTPNLGTPNARTLLSTETGLFIGTRTGIFRWDDAAQQWLNAAPNLPQGGVNVLRSDPNNPAVIYAGTSGNGLYRSVDGGLTWEQVSASALGITNLAVDPTNSEHLFMLAAWERAYESWDGGRTWLARWEGFGKTLETVSLVIGNTSPEPTVYVGAEWGLYRTQGNARWDIVGDAIIDETMLSLLVSYDGPHLYIGATRGVYHSQDRGETIEGCEQGWGCGLVDISVTALLADPSDSNRLFAGTAYAGVYQSLDGGESWQPIGPIEAEATVIEEMTWGPDGALFIAGPSGVWQGVVE